MNEPSPEAPDADPQITSIRDQAGEFLDGAVAMRRRLHEWPELGNDLPITRDVVLESLEGLPLDVTTHETTSGIVALLDDQPGKLDEPCGKSANRVLCDVAAAVIRVLGARGRRGG